MGKILDEFVKKFNLSDGAVLSLIGSACVTILHPEWPIPHPEPDEVTRATLCMMEQTARDMVIAELSERMMKGDDPFDPIIEDR